MSTVGKVIITTIIVGVLILGGWWFLQSRSTNMGNTSETSDSQSGENASESQEVALTITYDGTSFTPATVTAKAGDTIQIKNDSSNTLYFASDEHPTHLDNSELNVGDIQSGASATFTISEPGTWGYHDHYNASASGEIIIE